jgi:hypothetical protein
MGEKSKHFFNYILNILLSNTILNIFKSEIFESKSTNISLYKLGFTAI